MTALKQTRQQAGLSQAEASRLVGVNTRTWQRWESGESNPPKAAIELFNHKLECLKND